jgi:hypothetical protein
MNRIGFSHDLVHPVEIYVCIEFRGGSSMRSIFDLTTEEAYRIVSELGHPLPPLDAVENEDWGRDYVLQHFQKHSAEELARLGLSMEPSEEDW